MRMTRRTTAAWILLLVVTFVARAAEADYAKAVAAAQEQGNAAEVNRLCSEWAREAPGDERPRLILGRAFAAAGMTERAIEQFELAAEANPLSPTPRCELGQLLFRNGKYAMAAAEFDRALRVAPKHPPALLGKAETKLLQGDAEGALKAARSVLASTPGTTLAVALAGRALCELERPAEALADIERSLQQNPDNADMRYAYALTLEHLQRGDDAQLEWQRFLELESDTPRAMRVRNGWVLLGVEVLDAPFVGYGPAFSPDGKHLAFHRSYVGIFRAPVKGATAASQITPCPEGCIQRQLAWSPDGIMLAYQQVRQALPHEPHILRVRTEGGAAPETIVQANQPNPSAPAWSRSGAEMLWCDATNARVHLLDLHAENVRALRFRTEKGQRLFCLATDFLPGGACLVAQTAIRVDGAQLKGIHLASKKDGCVVKTLVECSPRQLTATAVSEDGMHVAYIALDEQPSLCAAAISGAPAHIDLCDSYVLRPSWHPEGRLLAASVTRGGKAPMALLRLGGLDARPVRIAVEREDDALAAVVTNRTAEPQLVSMRWEAFDAHSRLVGVPSESGEPVELKPGEKVEWPVEISAEDRENVRRSRCVC